MRVSGNMAIGIRPVFWPDNSVAGKTGLQLSYVAPDIHRTIRTGLRELFAEPVFVDARVDEPEQRGGRFGSQFFADPSRRHSMSFCEELPHCFAVTRPFPSVGRQRR